MRTTIVVAALLVSAPAAAAQAGGITPSHAIFAARADLPNGMTQDLGTREITVSDTTVDGGHAWVVVNTMKAGGQTAVDSVLMRAGDLRPILRHAQIGDTRLILEMRDSVLAGVLKFPTRTVPFTLRPGERAFLNYYALRAALRAWPVASGWRGTAGVAELNGRTELTPLALVVEGEERITVPAGAFDCWIVHVTGSGGIDERWWVDKATRHVVRTREPIGREGAIMQLDLTALTPPR